MHTPETPALDLAEREAEIARIRALDITPGLRAKMIETGVPGKLADELLAEARRRGEELRAAREG